MLVHFGLSRKLIASRDSEAIMCQTCFVQDQRQLITDVSVGLFPLCLALAECHSFVRKWLSTLWSHDSSESVTNTWLLVFWILFLCVITVPSFQTDAPWTKWAGAAELWRVDKAEEDEPTFYPQLTRTQRPPCPLWWSRKEPFASSCPTKTSWTSQSG